MNAWRRVVVPLMMVTMGLGCADHSTAPQSPTAPGEASPVVVVSLVTPHSDDGALLVSVNGPDLASIQATDSNYVLYSRAVNPQETRVVVIGDLVPGTLFTARIPAGKTLSAYTASIQEVAGRDDALRSDASGYELRIAPAIP
jgi:hypothetical protein